MDNSIDLYEEFCKQWISWTKRQIVWQKKDKINTIRVPKVYATLLLQEERTLTDVLAEHHTSTTTTTDNNGQYGIWSAQRDIQKSHHDVQLKVHDVRAMRKQAETGRKSTCTDTGSTSSPQCTCEYIVSRIISLHTPNKSSSHQYECSNATPTCKCCKYQGLIALAAIRIYMQNLPKKMQRAIEAQVLPFGRIVESLPLEHRISEVFTCNSADLSKKCRDMLNIDVLSHALVFGRINCILVNEIVIAQVIEILPPIHGDV